MKIFSPVDGRNKKVDAILFEMTPCDELWTLCRHSPKDPTDAENGIVVKAVKPMDPGVADGDVSWKGHLKLAHQAGFVARVRYVPVTSSWDNRAADGLVRVSWASDRSAGVFGWALKLFPEATGLSRNMLFISTVTDELSPFRTNACTDAVETSACGRFVQLTTSSVDTLRFSKQGRVLTLIPVVATPVPQSLTDALATMQMGDRIAYLHDGERFVGQLDLVDAFIASEFADTRLNFGDYSRGPAVTVSVCSFFARMWSGLFRVLCRSNANGILGAGYELDTGNPVSL
jgi:hypothetical protein